jgi:hypothetical protein
MAFAGDLFGKEDDLRGLGFGGGLLGHGGSAVRVPEDVGQVGVAAGQVGQRGQHRSRQDVLLPAAAVAVRPADGGRRNRLSSSPECDISRVSPRTPSPP